MRIFNIAGNETRMQQLATALVNYYDPEIQCSPGWKYPTIEDIRASDRVYVVVSDTALVPFLSACTRNDGRIIWLNARKQDAIDNAALVFARIYADLGRCYGKVKNESMRQRLIAREPRVTQAQGAWLEWVP